MARAPLFAARRSAQVTAHGTPVSGPGATAKWKRCGTEARVLLGGACAALASTFLGPSSPQHGARLPAWPRVWSPAPPPDMSPRDPDPGCFPGELPGGPGALGRMIVTGQTAETSPSLGRDEKATGWWDGRRSWQHRWLRSKGPIVNCSAGLEQTHPPWAAGALLLVGRVQIKVGLVFLKKKNQSKEQSASIGTRRGAPRAAACKGAQDSLELRLRSPRGALGCARAPRPPISGSRDLDASLKGEEGVQGLWITWWPMRLEQVGVDMQVSWRPSSGKGQNRGLAVPVLPGKRRWRGPRRPPHARPVLGFPAGGQAGRPSSGAARSRARGRRGGAVARGCHLVPAAAALATDGRRALRPCLPPRGLKSGKDSTAAAFQ
ncbi:protein CEI isoform X1 [Sus scrofa]|uniref:protein CEI isoform X1 n=1 Tax=Sus scrofa TaxID=9823 RepID=UPI0006B20354|nr:protein CEI isoform X1 [Sus scrofa]